MIFFLYFIWIVVRGDGRGCLIYFVEWETEADTTTTPWNHRQAWLIAVLYRLHEIFEYGSFLGRWEE